MRKRLYDNLYGFIDFERELFDKVVQDPFFLRLHNIKQMGLAFYVFPDAVHTRFSHSLGVYSIVNRVLQQRKEHLKPNDIDLQKVLLSALLHDIGHLPLSHTIESALAEFEKRESEEEKHKSKSDFFAESSQNIIETGLEQTIEKEKPKIALHEKLGEEVLKANEKISTYLGQMGIVPLDISAGFKGDIASVVKEEQGTGSFYSNQIRNFLHSQMDADRIDYILRDSGFTGVKTGGFDIDKLLNSIFYDTETNYGIDQSGIRALEQFLMSRFSALCQIVGNKSVSAFEFMAKELYLSLLDFKKKGLFDIGIPIHSYRDIISLLKTKPWEFLSFTDDYFFTLIREVMKQRKRIQGLNPNIVKYAEMITNVRPLVPVTYCEIFSDFISEEIFIDRLRKDLEFKSKIAFEAGITIDEIIIPEQHEFSLFKTKNDPIQVYCNGNKMHDNVSECRSSLLQFIADKELLINRVYTFDREKAGQLKEVLIKHSAGFKHTGDLLL